NTRQERGFAEFAIPYEVFKLFWSRIAGSEDDLEGLVVVVDNNIVAHDLTFMGARNTISIELPPGSRIVEINSVVLPSKRPEMTLASSSLWVSPGDSLRVNGTVSNIDRISDISITVKVQDALGNIIYDNKTRTDANGNYAASIIIPEVSVGGLFEISATPILDKVPRLEGRDAFYVNAEPALYSLRTHEVSDVFQIISNSTFYEPYFLKNARILGLFVSGAGGTNGTASMAFKHSLLGGDLELMIAMPATSSLQSNSTHSTVDINYRHDGSIQRIEVVGTTAIPEFGALALITLAIVIGFVSAFMRIQTTNRRSGVAK
ncbi:MAG: hypothetical protein ACREBU_19730, partial [Nitrososphaera sp.]